MAFPISPYWAGAMPGERGGEKGREGDAGNGLPLNARLRKINIRFIFKYMPVNETHAHESMPFLEAVFYWN